jgi:hypothetical protein
MGGAMAYGGAKLSEGIQAAGAAKAVEEAAKSGAVEGTTAAITPGSGYVPEGGMGAGSTISSVPSAPTPPAGAGYDYSSGLSEMPGNAAQAYTPPPPPPSLLERAGTAVQNIPSNIESGLKSFGQSAGKVFDPATYQGVGGKLADTAGGTLDNMGTAAKGLGNLAGFGADGTAAAARTAFTNVVTPTAMAAGIMGYSGMAALEEQQKALDQQLASGAIGNAEYAAAKAKIDEQVASARATVAANPLQTSADTSNITEGPSLYTKKSTGFDTLYDKNPTGGTTLYEQAPVNAASGGMINRYAMGGAVNPPDDQTYLPNQTPMQRLENSGIMSLASGGMPRFLSGGGDGMSDSIKANINGRQEARLADGEFVIPADVVSHLGNGSSKAGAKQLYSMMDKVRQARVGTKKQGKQINPRKYLAA